MSVSDEQLKKAFIEMESRLQTASRQLSTLRAQVQAKERERRICELSAKELDAYSESTISYKSVGKMFLQTELSTLKLGLISKAADNEKEIKVLQKAAQKLESEASDAERGMKELLNRRMQQ